MLRTLAVLVTLIGVSTATAAPKPKPVDPPAPGAIDAAIGRGIDFLLESQNADGSWGSPHNTKGLNIYAPVPGAHHAFHTAVTAMCISALIEADSEREGAATALDRAEPWLLEHVPKLRRATPAALYNNWGHAYAIQALARMLERHSDDAARREKILETIQQQVGMLERFECVGGGWAYYDMELGTKKPFGPSVCFLTGTVLIALDEARRVGVEVPERLVERGKASIERQRKPDASYCYSEQLRKFPMYGINRPAGSLGRSQVCNLALRRWGDKRADDELLATWLDRLYARNLWLDLGRKRPVPHESWFAVAGYFFYYGHYYGALCIEELPEHRRQPYRNWLAAVLLPLQEKDGSWWDFPLYNYHKPYGTAFAVMSLVRARAPQ